MSLFRVKQVAEGRFVTVHVSDVGEDQDCDDQYEAGQNPVGQKQDKPAAQCDRPALGQQVKILTE